MLIRERLRTTKVFLVLDDVEADQVRSLLDVHALAPGSLVLATSRLRDVLEEAGCDPVVEVDTLSPSASAELFMYYAERSQRVPSDVDSALIGEAISICGGLPLSLRVRAALLASDSPQASFDGLHRHCAPQACRAPFDAAVKGPTCQGAQLRTCR